MSALASVHYPHFAATAFRQRHATPPAPLILIQDTQVYAACPDATRQGVQPRQPEQRARALCPGAAFYPAEPYADLELFQRVLNRIEAHTEEVEPIPSPQAPHFVFELPVRQTHDILDLTKQLGSALRDDLTIPPAIAVASNIFAAKTVARLTPPGNVRLVSERRTPALLAPLPLSILPLSEEVQARLRRLGITRVGQFADLPASSIAQQFGKEARIAYDLAHGRDATTLRPRVAAPSIELPFLFEESVTYAAPIHAALHHLATRLSAELLGRRVSTTVLWLTVRCDDRSRQERRRTLRAPLRMERDLLTELGLLFKQMKVSTGIVELRVIAQGLVGQESGSVQMSFFDRLAPKSVFEQWWPRLLQRHGHAPFRRLVWVEDREGRMPEEQFELHPF